MKKIAGIDEVISVRIRGIIPKLAGMQCIEMLGDDAMEINEVIPGLAGADLKTLLPYHTHPCSESITVLEGEAEIAVEGRIYRLGPLDNITIPRWLPHQARNPDSGTPARLQIVATPTSE